MSGLTSWRPGSPSPSIPVVLSAPHGGSFCPAHIPDRVSGCLCPDSGSMELAEEIHDEFARQINASPHLVACHLHRSKLDANRSRSHAAAIDSQNALETWDCYHSWLHEATREILTMHGFALLLDIHGQEHRENATELGYGLSASDLLRQDSELDTPPNVSTSLNALLKRDQAMKCSTLIRGPFSLGTLMEQQGLNATPSKTTPQPVSADALRACLKFALRREACSDVNISLRRLLIRHGYADEENVNTMAESFHPYIDATVPTFSADDPVPARAHCDEELALRLIDVPTEGVYFGGSYTIQSFGQMPGVVAIQVETPCWARESADSRKTFADRFVKAVLEWLRIHYHWMARS